jgi:hypothetical protein
MLRTPRIMYLLCCQPPTGRHFFLSSNSTVMPISLLPYVFPVILSSARMSRCMGSRSLFCNEHDRTSLWMNTHSSHGRQRIEQRPSTPPAMLKNFTPEQMQQKFAFFQYMLQQGTHLNCLRLSLETEMSVRFISGGASLQRHRETASDAPLPSCIPMRAAASAQTGSATTSPDTGAVQTDQERHASALNLSPMASTNAAAPVILPRRRTHPSPVFPSDRQAESLSRGFASIIQDVDPM